MKWSDSPREDGRMEFMCPHGVGHGNHIHGCDGCCKDPSYPGAEHLNMATVWWVAGNPQRVHWGFVKKETEEEEDAREEKRRTEKDL